MAGWSPCGPTSPPISDRVLLWMILLHRCQDTEIERTDSTSIVYNQYRYHRHFYIGLPMILEQNSALMVKLQPMENTSHTLGVSNVKLRETLNLFCLHQTKHSGARLHSRSRSYYNCHLLAGVIVGHIQEIQ